MSSGRAAPVQFTKVEDEQLLEQVVLYNPWDKTKKHSWSGLVTELSTLDKVDPKLRARTHKTLNERVKMIMAQRKAERTKQDNASGIEVPDPTSHEKAIDECLELKAEADEDRAEGKKKARFDEGDMNIVRAAMGVSIAPKENADHDPAMPPIQTPPAAATRTRPSHKQGKKPDIGAILRLKLEEEKAAEAARRAEDRARFETDRRERYELEQLRQAEAEKERRHQSVEAEKQRQDSRERDREARELRMEELDTERKKLDLLGKQLEQSQKKDEMLMNLVTELIKNQKE